ncbi:WXG100 family type VII secretion target [Streptomyces sp. NPDC091272]|uniref:WXG100 family type VII secretion target n=1 Tax=Streptomyces sp. NPDC091272 TaxID=3365981 RepID=UPI003806766E
MPLDQQKLDDASLTKLQTRLTHGFDGVKGTLHKLNATLDNLEGQWRGIGAGAFNQKQSEINQRIVEIGKLLLKFQEGIEAARTITGNTEDEVLQAMRGVDVVGGYQGDARVEANTSNLNKF